MKCHKLSFPHKLGKTASPILEPLYHGFKVLRYAPRIGEELKLNIVLYQGAASGSLFGVRL